MGAPGFELVNKKGYRINNHFVWARWCGSLQAYGADPKLGSCWAQGWDLTVGYV